jgi:phage baseplate assembly protein W
MNVANLKTKNWAMDLNNPGQVLTDIDSINQCIYTILTTVPGTDPYNPLFGCDMYSYTDQPVNIAIPNMIREIGIAIEKFEPRAIVKNITVELDVSQATFSVYWTSTFGDSVTIIPTSLQ